MTTETAEFGELGPATDADTARPIAVALGRRVMVLGDLLLPLSPSASSLATSRDIAQRLSEWQGPGIVVLCGQMVAPGCGEPLGRAEALRAHPELTAAFAAFAARPDSQVIVVGGSVERDELAGELAD